MVLMYSHGWLTWLKGCKATHFDNSFLLFVHANNFSSVLVIMFDFSGNFKHWFLLLSVATYLDDTILRLLIIYWWSLLEDERDDGAHRTTKKYHYWKPLAEHTDRWWCWSWPLVTMRWRRQKSIWWVHYRQLSESLLDESLAVYKF